MRAILSTNTNLITCAVLMGHYYTENRFSQLGYYSAG